MNFVPNIGAVDLGNGRRRFRVWAPFRKRVQLHVLSPRDALVDMHREARGYWTVEPEGVDAGALYLFRLDESVERPDPASFDQPEGVHGPSRVIDPAFDRQDENWSGPSLEDYIFYEIHVGAFTPEGTFDAVIPRLDSLAELGVTSLELMPVAQFSGRRNWGYDGVYPFAVQNSYGGPGGLRRLVDACHARGLSVTLDVVYNHLGPEGNYLRDFGPYFTDTYKTPWGEAVNFDGAYSDEVRNFFIQNALFWFTAYHIDALRLDAVHTIFDRSAYPFLAQLADRVGAYRLTSGRRALLIAESDLNDSRLVRARHAWGSGMDAQWSDDFHHALHALLTGERGGYYADFGATADLVKALEEGYVYSGGYSEFRKRSHGNYSAGLPSERFVVASQNHDQVGNRMLGERLSTLVSFEAQKAAAAMVLFSPFVPLLFMGQEYGEEAPFLYFVEHSDRELAEAVRKGRRDEFKEFTWTQEPPDPNLEETFLRSRIDWESRTGGRHALLLAFYRELIRMRRELPALAERDRKQMEVAGFEDRNVIVMKRKSEAQSLVALFNLGPGDQRLDVRESGLEKGHRKIIDSSDAAWGGPGSSLPDGVGEFEHLVLEGGSVAVYLKN